MIQKKVRMVGTSGVGKTSLVAKFVHSMFSDKYLTTVQYDAIEYPSRRGWGHTCADDTVHWSRALEPNNLPFFIMIPIITTQKLPRWSHARREKWKRISRACT